MSKFFNGFFDDHLTRRRFVETAAKTCLGVSLLPGLEQIANASKTDDAVKGKRMIYLFMQGAMSQLDTFDPKPESKVQGATKAIPTKLTGVQFGESLPKLAGMADKISLVRSMTTETADHQAAQYVMRTSYRQIATTEHPGWGSLLHNLSGRIDQTLPASVLIGGGQGPGYLGAKYAPVPIGDPNKGLENTLPPKYLSESQFDRRMQLAGRFDKSFREKAKTNPEVVGYDELYREAIALMKTDDLKAFDLRKEPKEVRDRYGRGRFEQGCLLARRLIENDVRYVEVTLNGWDHHVDIAGRLGNMARQLDNGLSSLLADLEASGLLDETVVVVGTEFGRTPGFNANAGRDHHPAAFSCLLAGAGIKTGRVFGATDADAFEPDEDPITIEEFNATIGTALGLDLKHQIISPDGRPFKVGNGGDPIKKLLA